jgi:hypothetical protein
VVDMVPQTFMKSHCSKTNPSEKLRQTKGPQFKRTFLI